MRDRREFKGILELHLDPCPCLFYGAVEYLIQSITLGKTLFEVRKITVIPAVFFFAEYFLLNKLHINVLSIEIKDYRS